MYHFWRRNNSQSSWKRNGGKKSRISFKIIKKYTENEKIVISSAGTDGVDGNSVFAGAITENVKVDLDLMKEFLKNSDSGRFFQKQKGNIKTNPTHTNLMDIGVILK
jgi:Putative glycerate kinase